MQIRNHTSKIDWVIFSLYLSLVFIGWLMIYAVESNGDSGQVFDITSLISKQIIFIAISFVLLLVILNIDWKFWRNLWLPVYGISILSLIAVLIFGLEVKGARSWFAIGPFTIQPSEFAKFATALALANYLSIPGMKLNRFKNVLIAFAIMLTPVLLILLQQDAGSALVFIGFLIVLYIAGLSTIPIILGLSVSAIFILTLLFDPMTVLIIFSLISLFILMQNLEHQFYWNLSLLMLTISSVVLIILNIKLYLLIILLGMMTFFVFYQIKKGRYRLVSFATVGMILCTALSLGTNYAYNNILEPHQQDRFNVWLHPERCDPHGPLYNVVLSKIAIGSGGFSGKGFLHGNLTKLNYVPEQSTDFIFCTVGEEQGFVGSIMIIALFTLLLVRLVKIAERQRLGLFRFYAYGVLGVLFIHFVINIGMTMGLLPIIGIPLPFISYGGSSLLAFTLMIGVLLKFDSQRY